jgi:hypothetical protein
MACQRSRLQLYMQLIKPIYDFYLILRIKSKHFPKPNLNIYICNCEVVCFLGEINAIFRPIS